MSNPKAFISYAWESDKIKAWVKKFATQLRTDGVDVKLDQWELALGDQIPHFMERFVKGNDYVLIICTPKYKEKSDDRIGGVGYEGDIMTAEVIKTSNHRKFIPVLKLGTEETSIPSWLGGAFYVDLSDKVKYEKNYPDLTTTLLNQREPAPKIGQVSNVSNSDAPVDETSPQIVNVDVKIKGIVVDEVTQPSNDGSRGSALYKIPFELNQTPDYEWCKLFIDAWNYPPRFTSMHRPGIASVIGNKIFLNGTTIEEVEKYHRDTLMLAVDEANKKMMELKKQRQIEADKERQKAEEHKKNLEDGSKRIKFD